MVPDSSHPQPTPERILQSMNGFAPLFIIHAPIKNSVFDQLAEAPNTLDQLLQNGSLHSGLRALSNALVGLQLLTKD